MSLPIYKTAEECRYDILSLGEIMLRLDPGDERIHTARSFRAWEGGGEYNVARGLRRCFGLRAGVVTAFADNPVGRLIEDFIMQGGVALGRLKVFAGAEHLHAAQKPVMFTSYEEVE